MTEIQPLYISVKKAGQVLGLPTWDVRELCESGAIESRWSEDDRRLVSVESVRAYAAALPTERQDDHR